MNDQSTVQSLQSTVVVLERGGCCACGLRTEDSGLGTKTQ